MNSRVEQFRRLLKEEEMIYTSGVATPMQAKILEMIGFKVAHLSGYAASLTYLAMSDVGLLTATEMIANASYIVKSVNIPVVADADNGYGNAINVTRTVRDYEYAGVAGIHIEDQVAPKRCGHLAGKQLVPLDEAVGKIKAAVDAKQDKNFVIIARTDARGAVGGSLEKAIQRGKAYANAGADMLFCEFTSPDAVDESELFARKVHKDWPDMPLLYNYSSSFKWYKSKHKLTFRKLSEIGYKLIVVSLGIVRAGLQAEWDYANALFEEAERGEFGLEERLENHITENFHKFSGFDKIKELENKYLPREETLMKYEKSLGHGTSQ